MPLLPALRAFFTRLLTDVDDALFPQHVFCLTCGALSLPNAICPACLAVLDDLRLPSDALAPNAAAVWSYHGIARQLVLMLKYSGIAECAQVLADGSARRFPCCCDPYRRMRAGTGGRHGIRVSLCPAAGHGCHLRPDDEEAP